MTFEKNIVLALNQLFPKITFVFAYRNHTEVNDPFCLIQQVSMHPISSPYINTSYKKDEKPIEIVMTPVECKFFLSFYAQSDSELQEIGLKIFTGLKSNRFGFAFSENKLSVNRVTDMLYMGEEVNGTTILKKGVITLDVSGVVVDEWEVNGITELDFIGVDKGSNDVFFKKEYDMEKAEWKK